MNVARLLNFIRQPRLWRRTVVRRIHAMYQLHVLKNPFHVAHRQWVRDRGDATLRLDYDLKPGSTVLDVGGYHGDFADAMQRKHRCAVYLFEPVGDFFRICERRFSACPQVQCFEYGLSDTDEEMFIARDDDASSTARRHDTHLREKIQLRDVAAALHDIGIAHVDLLKINIEGGEYDVLPRLIETGWIENIRFLQIQFHDFVPDATDKRKAIRAQLARTHAQQWNYPFVWESWQRT